MTTFSITTYKQLAAQAGRGDLRALETSLRNLGGAIEGLSPTEIAFIDGVTAGVASASKALVLGTSGEVDALTVTTLKCGVTAGSTEANISNTGTTTLGSTTATAYTLGAPAAGVHKVITMTGATTAAQTVTLASGTFDGTNNTATFNAAAETLVLEGLTTAAYCVSSNVGSVALSSV